MTGRLVAFVSMTTMHERYAYPAFVFLLMAANTRVLLVAWAAFAVAFAANLVWAAPAPELSLRTWGRRRCWARGSSRWSR